MRRWLLPLLTVPILVAGIAVFGNPLWLLALLLPGIIYLGLKYPKLAFWFYVAGVVNLDALRVGSASLDMFVTFSFVGLACLMLFSGRMHIYWRFSLLYLLFLAVSVVSVMVSPDPLASLMFWGRYLTYLFMVNVTLHFLTTEKDIHRFILVLMGASLLPSLVGIVQVLTGHGAPLLESGLVTQVKGAAASFTRAQGTLSHPNFLAFFLMDIIIFALVYYLEIPKGASHLRWVPILVLPITTVALLMTFTRGAIIGCLLGLVMYAILKRRYALLALLIASVPLMLFIPGVAVRIKEMMDLQFLLSGNSSFAWRLHHWESLVNSVRDNLLFGNGFKSVFMQFGFAPHNEYLGFLVETGVLGLTVFVCLIGMLLKTSLKLLRYRGLANIDRVYVMAYLCVLVPTIVTAASDNVFSVPSSIIYFWLLTGGMMAVYLRARGGSLATQ